MLKIFDNHILYVSQHYDVDTKKEKSKRKLWQYKQMYMSKRQAGTVSPQSLMVNHV